MDKNAVHVLTGVAVNQLDSADFLVTATLQRVGEGVLGQTEIINVYDRVSAKDIDAAVLLVKHYYERFPTSYEAAGLGGLR